MDAITDVSGLEVGYQALIEGDNVRTGVTAPAGPAGLAKLTATTVPITPTGTSGNAAHTAKAL